MKVVSESWLCPSSSSSTVLCLTWLGWHINIYNQSWAVDKQTSPNLVFFHQVLKKHHVVLSSPHVSSVLGRHRCVFFQRWDCWEWVNNWSQLSMGWVASFCCSPDCNFQASCANKSCRHLELSLPFCLENVLAVLFKSWCFSLDYSDNWKGIEHSILPLDALSSLVLT